MIKYIFFDLDDTILDFHKAEYAALKKTLVKFGIEANDAVISRYSEINQSQWKFLEKGEITREEVKYRRFKLLFDELKINCEPDDINREYESNLAVGHYFMPGAEQMILSLFSKYDLYIVTNGTQKVQNGRIKSADIAKYFKDIFISQQIGHNKPEKAFFDACFSTVKDFNRERAIIVGDSLSSDILGGKNAGIKTLWFNQNKNANTTDVLPDYEAHSCDEVTDIIMSI